MIAAGAHTTTPRLFVSEPLHAGAVVNGLPEQARYLGLVLRRATGDLARLFNGVDGEWLSRLTFARADRPAHGITLTVIEKLRAQTTERGPWLLFAPLKRDATDLVIRQAVELGASRILPVLTARTNTARLNGDRLRAIAIEAAEQSERLTVPDIVAPARLEAILADWPRRRELFVALERSWPATPPPARANIGADQEHAAAALLIGPEGGFTSEEQAMARRHAFVTPISLGPFVLRAETAAVAGLALLLGLGWAEYPGAN